MINHKIAFLFPGQGAQFPGMAKDLWEAYPEVRELFEKASAVLHRDMEALLFKGSEAELKETLNTQVAVTLASLSVLRALKAEGLNSSCAAGFSLGEFSAMVDAEILSEEDALSLVMRRGEIMTASGDRAVREHGEVGMGAVLGLDFDSVLKVLSESPVKNVFAANDNSPSQVVISGTVAGIAQVSEALKEAGAKRVIPLKVSGPFHTPLLEAGIADLAAFMESLNFAKPVKDFYSNVSGEPVKTGEDVRRLSIRQMVSPVRWLRIEQNIAASGIELVIEAGPGTVLSGLWKKSALLPQAYSCGTLAGLKEFMEKIMKEKGSAPKKGL